MTVDLFTYADTYPQRPGFKEHGGTSQESAERIEPHAAYLRERVLTLFTSGQRFTADEVAAALCEPVLSIRPRVSELGTMGLLVKTSERRLNASGHSAVVWRGA